MENQWLQHLGAETVQSHLMNGDQEYLAPMLTDNTLNFQWDANHMSGFGDTESSTSMEATATATATDLTADTGHATHDTDLSPFVSPNIDTYSTNTGKQVCVFSAKREKVRSNAPTILLGWYLFGNFDS